MSQEFDFKEYDLEGYKTLEAISAADRFNYWMYETIRPYCNGKVLEIGSGIGNISAFFLNDGYDITLTDIRDNYRELLRTKFPQAQVLDLDLVHSNFEAKYTACRNSYDTVFAMNVVEHIHDDQSAINNCKLLLKRGGNLVILVPAFQSMYNRIDESLEHYRRYNKKSLAALFDDEFVTIKSTYFNAAGLPGWFVAGALFREKTIHAGSMKLYNAMVPFFRIMDKPLRRFIGLSVIHIGRFR